MTTISPESFYHYFKDCYKLDYKEFVVDNLLSTKYKYKWFVSDKEELFSDHLPLIPYNNSKLSDLKKDMELYKLEKKLFYGAFFILGVSDNPLVKDKRICAPLVLFPANIVHMDDLDYLEIDREAFIINSAILSKLDTVTKDLFITEFANYVANDTGNCLWLKGLLEKYFSNLDGEELLLTPEVWSSSKIRLSYSKSNYSHKEYQIVPAAGTVLIDKSESSLRVLNDLNNMAGLRVFNDSLTDLLGKRNQPFKYESSFYKSRLNVDQYQALKRAHEFKNSVLIGPPGTGKSYTITSIVADAIVHKKSVLVVSKTKQAVEVIRTMLENDFRLNNYLIHTTGNKYKLSLKAKIQKYLSGITSVSNRNTSMESIHSTYTKLSELEKDFSDFVEKELRLSDLNFKSNPGFFDRWKKAFIKLAMGNGDKIWTLFDQMNKQNEKLDREVKTYSKYKIEKNIEANSRFFRKDISLFYDALDSASFTESKQISENVAFHNILKVFPVWLANLSDLNSVLPLQKDLFDLVIIDEATQCDIASALPAIYRAKHVVISGDPNQLRHYSFVSHAQQSNLLKKYSLPVDKIFDYRNRSILDFYISKVQDQQQITFYVSIFAQRLLLLSLATSSFMKVSLKY